MHGANKSGLPFIGDASGDLLYRVLGKLAAVDRVRITNAVKCLPIKNSPTGRELENCAQYLRAELATHTVHDMAECSPVVLALGGVAHRAIIRTLIHRQVDYAFAHGAVHQLGELTLVDSYHCSRYNTQTGRLTEPMFTDVVVKALRLTRAI